MVGAQCLPARGDVGDGLCGFILDRAFGRPLAVDQRIIRDTGAAQEFPHQPVVFRRDAQAEPVLVAEGRGGGIQIIERINIDPGLRHRDDQIGMPEGELFYRGDKLIAVDAMNDSRAYMVGKRLIEAGKSPDPALVADSQTDLKALLKP